MREVREAEEVKEAKEANENSSRVAAFFDLDGTLMPLPSLEKRLFRMLRYRREIRLKNYFLWLMEAARFIPRGIHTIAQPNKVYLRGVRSLDERELGIRDEFPGHTGVGQQDEGEASATPFEKTRRNPREPVLSFFEEGVERVAWHASQGHVIVIVSGTLEPLANAAGRELEGEVAARRVATKIHVCATRLEKENGRWTGRILGEAMFGETKARALKKLTEEMELDLARCYAYGNSANDQWMLAAVGNAIAVNPAPKLTRIAKKCRWLVLKWNEKKGLTRRTQRRRD